MKRCLFLLRRECIFEVAHLPSGFDDGTVYRHLCLKHSQLFSDPLTLFQIIIEEAKAKGVVLFLP